MSSHSGLWSGPPVSTRSPAQWDDLWRPGLWRTGPEDPQRSSFALALLIALLVYANVVINEVQAPPWYVPFNLVVLLVSVLIARGSGATWISLGLDRERLGRGTRHGLAVGAVVAIGVVVASFLPAVSDAFDDARVTDGTLVLTNEPGPSAPKS